MITAYRVRDGVPVMIPAHWIGHPVLGAPFSPDPPGSIVVPSDPAVGEGGTAPVPDPGPTDGDTDTTPTTRSGRRARKGHSNA